MPTRILIGVPLSVESIQRGRSEPLLSIVTVSGSPLWPIDFSPKFKSGMFRKGVELSPTHLKLKGTDGKAYDVAIDNVFASGYQKKKGVPAPLNTIKVGDKLEVCGIPFSGGIHWVHNNCGDTPTSSEPDGWMKKVSAAGSVEQNLETSQKDCYLWPHH